MKNWEIIKIISKPKVGNLTEVAFEIFWRRFETLNINGNNYTIDKYGVYECANPNPDDFTPYNELKENTVIGWLDNGVNVNVIDKQIDDSFLALTYPNLENYGLPWA